MVWGSTRQNSSPLPCCHHTARASSLRKQWDRHGVRLTKQATGHRNRLPSRHHGCARCAFLFIFGAMASAGRADLSEFAAEDDDDWAESFDFTQGHTGGVLRAGGAIGVVMACVQGSVAGLYMCTRRPCALHVHCPWRCSLNVCVGIGCLVARWASTSCRPPPTRCRE
jgi:hypothetical protein